MSAVHDIDVLVCGLGPAGACAAAAAAGAGASVLAVERNALPGLPVQCAEFVPMMIDSSPCLWEARIQNIEEMLTFVEDDGADLTADFRGYMIDRARFDAGLIEQARSAGAECRFATPVRLITQDGVVQLASGTSFKAKIMIGADGPRSRVAKAAGLPNRQLVETRQITVDLQVPHRGTDIFLRSDIVGGYGWLFPKGALCNVGLGVVAAEKHRLKPLLEALHARLVAAGRVGTEIRAHTGGAIPVGGISGLHARLGQTRILLAGDAAGLANPVTGAGINAAVISGTLAGEAAAAIVDGDEQAADDYAEEIDAVFGRSLSLATKRRNQLLARHRRGGEPRSRRLRDGWIAYPQYWQDEETASVCGGSEKTRMLA